MPAYRPYRPIDPLVPMLRADLVIELLTLWEEAMEVIQRNPNGTLQELGTMAELDAAIHVLKRSCPVSELMGFEAYEQLRNEIDAHVPISYNGEDIT